MEIVYRTSIPMAIDNHTAEPYHTTMESPPPPKTHLTYLLLSDIAFNNLRRQAIDAKYIWPDAVNSRGLAKYIAQTVMNPVQDWLDTRPHWMREESTARLDPNRPLSPLKQYRPGPQFPIWWDPDTTPTRAVRTFTPRIQPVIEHLSTLAIRYGVTTPWAHEYRFHHPVALASCFVEAWGQHNITPTVPTLNPDGKPAQRHSSAQYARRNRKELIW